MFWFGLIAAIILAYHSVKRGLVETWAYFLNILFTVYLAIFLTPVVSKLLGIEFVSYANAMVLAGLGIGIFLLFYVMSFVFLTGDFRIQVPKIFDIGASALLGVFGGMLIWGFLGLLVILTPISNNKYAGQIGFSPGSKYVSYVSWWCDKVHNFSGKEEITTSQIISRMVTQHTAKTTKTGIPDETPEQTTDHDQSKENFQTSEDIPDSAKL